MTHHHYCIRQENPRSLNRCCRNLPPTESSFGRFLLFFRHNFVSSCTVYVVNEILLNDQKFRSRVSQFRGIRDGRCRTPSSSSILKFVLLFLFHRIIRIILVANFEIHNVSRRVSVLLIYNSGPRV